MQKNINEIKRAFSGRKVSLNQAVKSLRRNGIHVDEDQAIIILDFLYLLASSFKKIDDNDACRTK